MESESLDEEMQQRRELQGKIEAETRIVTKVGVHQVTLRETYVGVCSVGVSSLQEKESAEELNTEARRKLEDYKVPDVSQLVTMLLTITESGMPKSYTDLFMCVCLCMCDR